MSDDIVVTGDAWVGRGVPSVESALRRLIKGAEDEIQWTIYSVSAEAREMFDLIEERLVRGVKVVIVLNQFKEQPAAIRNRIRVLLAVYRHFEVHDFAPADKYAKLHAKVLVVDRKVAVVGSANVSRGGFLRNHEIGIIVRGKTAAQLGLVFDRLVAGRGMTTKVSSTAPGG